MILSGGNIEPSALADILAGEKSRNIRGLLLTPAAALIQVRDPAICSASNGGRRTPPEAVHIARPG